ncbi:MAG: NAD(P)(+) transhydrogenase (Re/Si-specific) subunit beta, partial [Ferruginibacter sp.]
MTFNILTICYLIASVTFILGLKMLSHPLSARRGNLIAAAGMAIAIFATIFLYSDDDVPQLHNYIWIFGGIVIGTIIGFFSAKKVKMTAMPEMVSLFNGMGGACAMLISIVEFDHLKRAFQSMDSMNLLFSDDVAVGHYLTIAAGLIIGSVSFAGSVIAYLKLSGKLKDFSFKGQHIFNGILLLLTIGLAVYTYNSDLKTSGILFYCTLGMALLYGIFFVLPIGGADMPVVISLLNSFTGVAAACGGFMYNNKAMLTGGILVGAAGTLLTILMCKAMNRSLLNVVIGSFGGNKTGAAAGSTAQGAYKEISLSDAAMLMSYANKVMIVPGYGL